jgi:hypothetical protein
MAKKKYSLTLDKEVIAIIKSRCDPDLPLSRMIERYLKKGLESEEEQ